MENMQSLTKKICEMAPTFGFLDAKVAQVKIDESAQSNFLNWINTSFHGDMSYLKNNTDLRFNPELLHHGTLSIICVKAPYLTKSISHHSKRLENPNHAYISKYALGRDYHKVVKKQLKLYTDWIKKQVTALNLALDYRVFTDSAPILEIELAKNAGLGFRGKNTLLLNTTQGSTFFLGEIFTNLPLTPHTETTSHCGSCTKCLDICPTKAFVAPYILDATKCISYLTIENKGSIPIEYRKAIGNRIYGCDDCQLVCPWNKFSQLTSLNDFNVRQNLDSLTLIEAFNLTESQWQSNMQGSPIYRIGYIAWLRNVAVSLGNAPTSPNVIEALKAKKNHTSEMVREHVAWALEQHLIYF
jgi:epoxyqueuosine reductase